MEKKTYRRGCTLTIAVLVLLLAGEAGAVPVEEWNKSFGGTGKDGASSVQQSSDGGYIMAGYTESFGTGGRDAWLVKTDANANEIWSRIFGGANTDYANSVQQTSDGGYILAGRTEWLNGDGWLIKIDANGVEEWNKTFGDYGSDSAQSVQQTSDGGYIFAGTRTVLGWTDMWPVWWLVKTDSNGNIQWDKIMGYYGNALSVQRTSDGGYIAAGISSSVRYGPSHALLLKIDSQGNEKWNKIFDETHDNYVYSVRQTADSGYVLAGTIFSAGNYDAWFVKTDANGVEQWNKTFGGANADGAQSVLQTSDTGYILSGYTGSFGAGRYDGWLVKTNADGVEQWNTTFGDGGSESVQSVQQTSDGGYIMAGQTDSYSTGDDDGWLIKVSSEGGITSPVHNINKGTNYPTIQAAIDDASPGDEIHVESGTYYENVNVNKQLTLRGIGMSVVDARGSGSAITLAADGILLEGFTATGGGYEQAGIRVTLNNNTLIGNNASNNAMYGIILDHSNNITLSSNIVNSNSGYGIFLRTSSNNVLSDNNANSNNWDGIFLFESSQNNLLRGNNVSNGHSSGIRLDHGSNYNILIENNASNNLNGFSIGSSYNNILNGNIANSNSYSGIDILFYSSGNKIYHNNFVNNIRFSVDDRSGPINSWDDGYPSGGNYWSDYIGTDVKSGSNQDQLGSDSIGDMPYNIPCKNFVGCGGYAQDRYPLMAPYTGKPSIPTENQAPDQPIEINQFKSDGTTQIIVGGTTAERTVVISARVSDPDGNKVRLQVELRRTDEYGGQFDENKGGLKEGDLVTNGGIATASAIELIDGTYHWRARAVDEKGNNGAWVEFGGNLVSDADFAVASTPTPRQGITITSPVDIYPRKNNFNPGRKIMAQFSITNNANVPITVKSLRLGGRDPNGNVIDFSDQLDFTINPSDSHNYIGMLTLPSTLGQYHFFATYQTIEGNWITEIDLAPGLTNSDRTLDIDVNTESSISRPTEFVFEVANVDVGWNLFMLSLHTEEMLEKEKFKLGIEEKDKLRLFNDAIFLAYRIRMNLEDPEDIIKSGKSGQFDDFWSLAAGQTINAMLQGILLVPCGSPCPIGPALVAGAEQIGYKIGTYKALGDSGFIRIKDSTIGELIIPFKDEEGAIISYYGPNGIFFVTAKADIAFDGTILGLEPTTTPYIKLKNDIAAKLNSPGELRIYDSQDRITGLVNGMIKDEIPGSLYDNENERIYIAFSSHPPYRYEVKGTDTGTYGLDLIYNINGNPILFNAIEIPTNLGQNHQYTIDWEALSNGEKGVTLQIDSEGDGIFERTIQAGPTLTDITPPTTIADLSGTLGNNGWHISDVQVNLTSTDNEGGSGINKTEYSFDNTAWIEYNAEFPVTTEGATTLYYRSTDNAGNIESTKNITIRIDKTIPSITGAATTAANANGWYNTNAVVHFIASDEVSGIDTLTPDQTLSSEGASQSVTGTATDKAGNSASTTLSGIYIDKTTPQITINIPASEYILKQTILADWLTSDVPSGISSETGTTLNGGVVDTTSIGTKSYNVAAVDKAGNTNSKTVTYYVRYNYGGILQPVNADGSSVFKLGSTIPVKFQLKDADGNFVTNAVAKIYVLKVSGTVTGTELEAISTSTATTGNFFRYDSTSNQYIFNLGTKTLSAGTWQIRIELDDGISKYVNVGLK